MKRWTDSRDRRFIAETMEKSGRVDEWKNFEKNTRQQR